MNHHPTNNTQPKTCHICGEVKGREATQREVDHMIPPPKIMREYFDGKWTGNHICTRCYYKKRRGLGTEKAPIPSKIEICRAKYNICLRIVKGLPMCIERGSSLTIHHGIGCSGCPKDEIERRKNNG